MTRPRWKNVVSENFNYPECVFCGRDPYEYVDIGVGYQAVAVSCCDEGIGLYQYYEPALQRIAALLRGDERRIARGKRLLKRYGTEKYGESA